MTEPEPERCCFDDWVEGWDQRARADRTGNPVTDAVLAALTEVGVEGRTVLDVGCGIGDLAIETVVRGAARAAGFDLSPKAIGRARELAAERGVADRTRFEIGDGAKLELPGSDVVAVNRVVCCYANADGLLERSLAAAGSVYAITAPISKGATGLYNRVATRLSNVVYALRDRKYQGFRTFVHDVDRIDERIRSAGFRRVRHERRRVVWDLAVYTR